MNDIQDITALFSLLGNTRPQLKISEIGAGTGGLTSKILQSLQSEYGQRLYLNYMFTDVSSGFFVQAQSRFKSYIGIEYKVLRKTYESTSRSEEWDVRLRAAGFDRLSSGTLDGDKPYYLNANMLAQPAIRTNYQTRVTLLTHSRELGPLAQATREIIKQMGYQLDHCV
ncbi:Highly reducing polyketide synthase FUM1 [Lachnellula cervina]|uniref:Highly reducing polyketide synthase FUM1 n=1 Tax=Lachnellula cervina TaxID=1316786 RepID=A0A7D8V1D8_9HELO|nr:Highly reducing polyketide synthase FUM1 [Lachnellula cervina]